ncbi:hypothetical protein Fleli_3449 [Bernardetia litoralis DSM 6794]|uniref:Uncharacterized protein n=1 Tax=Bernardetia litoralis (strain ATCC 23117 / DSM 6794 / NBRC 15988 / NCIMB 1366 / Fx l1 / Sio-4) TaxID=880071 RepID=I4AP84_BERLS|nr:hypothetical protein [Bernardetia litoralis]AFM05769.1 hypothetical protein Fleli_3449 [Bernardetia litoralis DSM 6794]
MKKQLQILFALLSLFLLNGNGFLYAHTNQAKETLSSEEVVESYNQRNDVITDLGNQFRNSILQTDSFPSGKKKSKGLELSFFEKEEKEDKFTSFDDFIKTSFSSVSILDLPQFATFYFYNRNYLHVSDNLNYFLFHKCYIVFQVFRL